MRYRVQLTIHREDHKTDALGQIFLGALDRDGTLALLRRYLGPHASLRNVELDDAVLYVEASVRDFPDESRTLLQSARTMLHRGAVRGALAQLEEALRLSPTSAEVLKLIGRIHYRQRRRGPARHYLIRAREVAPQDLDLLRLLAEISLHDGQPLAARAYLHQLLGRSPGDPRARATLARLEPADPERDEASTPAPGGAGAD